MNIKTLYQELQDDTLQSILCGELTLKGNCIIWSYNLFENPKEIDDVENKQNDYNDDDNIGFGFEMASNEEILFEVYHEEIAEIKEFIEELDDVSEWSFSEPEIIDNTISFKIY